MCKICINHSGAMEGRLPVQERSNLRTGEIESLYRWETRAPYRGEVGKLEGRIE